MKIGIDVSQFAYENTGVANYLKNLVEKLIDTDKENNYVLFFSSLRKDFKFNLPAGGKNVEIKKYRIPPTLLDILWNKLHIIPIEKFVGETDVFITSDWTEPPAKKAKKVTILYDLIVYKYPHETGKKIVDTQKRKLKWVRKESERILCISEATKKDAHDILGIDDKKLFVIGAGI